MTPMNKLWRLRGRIDQLCGSKQQREAVEEAWQPVAELFEAELAENERLKEQLWSDEAMLRMALEYFELGTLSINDFNKKYGYSGVWISDIVMEANRRYAATIERLEQLVAHQFQSVSDNGGCVAQVSDSNHRVGKFPASQADNR